MASHYINRLSLFHFRSHKRSELELTQSPIVITGSNGSGKTNLLEAVSLFSPGRGLRRVRASQFSKYPERIGWKVQAELHTPERALELETAGESEGSRHVKVDGKILPQNALASHLRILWLTPSMDRLWIEAAEGRRRFLDRLTLSFCPNHAQSVLLYERAMRERNKLLKEGIRDPHWYTLLEKQMAERGIDIINNRDIALDRLNSAQSEAHTMFPIAKLSIEEQNFTAYTAGDLQQRFNDMRSIDMAAGRSLNGPHRIDLHAQYLHKNISAKDCSTGEQKALLISLILANSRALSQDTSITPVVLLDEVAAHLDKERRNALYDEIYALNMQAWLCGTEKGLFSDLGERAQYIRVSEAGGVSQVE